MMRSSDLRREENYNEYLRLLQDSDYVEVAFDEESGGMSAVHTQHKFSRQLGPYGIRRGDYERIVMKVLRDHGHRIILASEKNTPGLKSCDGYLDDVPMEIKAIEGTGPWTICKKMRCAEKQNAECVVLFFPEESLYSSSRVREGLRLFQSDLNGHHSAELSKVLVVVQDHLIAD